MVTSTCHEEEKSVRVRIVKKGRFLGAGELEIMFYYLLSKANLTAHWKSSTLIIPNVGSNRKCFVETRM